ncbi:hypothetical protein [Dehalogenimonas alkenigignens]|uniref:hypothetical protein n=1 Tax=Dehalogenimonas alkenigignens TaxID=1217799 RepID=UPI000D5739EB|nr:hypothetical protein [Dehalogenimonas alkenigignens]PVV82722.1 hypothetical protein DD509_07995 [Dehalogenimonas alkenigignens]
MLLLIISLALGIHFDLIQFESVVGPYLLTHWMGWVGVGVLAVSVPAYSILKRFVKLRSKAMLPTHIFGNILAFGLITIHFAQRLRFPDFDTGFLMYLMLSGLILTGMIKRFWYLPRINGILNYLHPGLALSLALTVPFHIARNLGLL